MHEVECFCLPAVSQIHLAQLPQLHPPRVVLLENGLSRSRATHTVTSSSRLAPSLKSVVLLMLLDNERRLRWPSIAVRETWRDVGRMEEAVLPIDRVQGRISEALLQAIDGLLEMILHGTL